MIVILVYGALSTQICKINREKIIPRTRHDGFLFNLYIPNNYVMVKKVENCIMGNEKL